MLVVKHAHQVLQQASLGRLTNFSRDGHQLLDQLRLAKRGQVYEPDAVRILGLRGLRHFQAEPRFAGTSGTRERQQADLLE